MFSRLVAPVRKHTFRLLLVRSISDALSDDDLSRLVQSRDGDQLTRHELASLIRRCTSSKALDLGKRLHCFFSQSRYAEEVFLGNLLVEMYGKCGCTTEAREVFASLGQRNVYSWTIIIAAHAANGKSLEALAFTRFMLMEGVKPDLVSFLTALDVCAVLADLRQGKLVHDCIVESGLEFQRPVVGNTLINMYGKCRSLGDAKALFGRMREHKTQDVVTWNALLAAHVQNGEAEQALKLFQNMELEGMVATSVTFAAVLDACSCQADLFQGRALHVRAAVSGFLSDAFVTSALVKMYARSGALEEARMVFEGMKIQKELVSWNVMISAVAQSGESYEALYLLKRMDLEGVQPDEVTFVSVVDACARLEDVKTCRDVYKLVLEAGLEKKLVLGNAMVNMFGKSRCLQVAKEIFDRLTQRNIVSWNCIISSYAQNEQGKEALNLFRQMDLEGFKANAVTFVSALNACATLQNVSAGEAMYERVSFSGLETHTIVATALINMYAKCQELRTAATLLESLQSRCLVSWNVMVSAYAQLGHTREAISALQRIDLEGLKADEVTYVGALEACVCSQDLKKGRTLHDRVTATGWISQTVVANTLINMYGKCGRLEEAATVFREMVHKDGVSWSTMVGAYAYNHQVPEAVLSFWRMQVDGVRPHEATYLTILDACGESPAALSYGKLVHSSVRASRAVSSDAVRGALVNMYGKCGNLVEARRVFDDMSSRSYVSWTAMIAAYAHLGHARQALELFQWMQQEGEAPDEVTFAAVVFACSHAGLLEEALEKFGYINQDYGQVGSRGQYECMVDVLARLGRLAEAEELVRSMPYEPEGHAWIALLGGCKLHGDVQRATRAAVQHKSMLEGSSPGTVQEQEEAGCYVLLSTTLHQEAA